MAVNNFGRSPDFVYRHRLIRGYINVLWFCTHICLIINSVDDTIGAATIYFVTVIIPHF